MEKIYLILVLIFSFSVFADDGELWMGNIGDEELSQSNFFGDDQLSIFVTEPICGNGICGIGESCDSCSVDCGVCSIDPGSGGGGRIVRATECNVDNDCISNKACLKNKCVLVDCRIDDNCKIDEGEVCRNYRCLKLFDVLIKKFESPAKIGGFFEFTYFIKGMANISDDVEILFWIEQNKTKITTGHDTIFVDAFEEKTITTELFLPSTVESGVYKFFVQLKHKDYVVDSHRTIEIIVDKEEGIAIITEREEPSRLDIKLVLILVMSGLIVISILSILISYFKKIKNKIFKK